MTPVVAMCWARAQVLNHAGPAGCLAGPSLLRNFLGYVGMAVFSHGGRLRAPCDRLRNRSQRRPLAAGLIVRFGGVYFWILSVRQPVLLSLYSFFGLGESSGAA